VKAVQQHMVMVTGLLEATTGLQQRTSALLPTTGQEEEHLQGGSNIDHQEHADHHEEGANEGAAQDSKEEDACSDAAFEELTSSGKTHHAPLRCSHLWKQSRGASNPG